MYNQLPFIEKMVEAFIAGSLSGLSQIIVGYPLDTYKVWSQTGMKRTNGNKPVTFCGLYSGVRYPLYTNCFYNSILFSSYEFSMCYVDNNPWIAGFISGIPSSLICTPVEMAKISKQVGLTTSFYWYRGFFPTFIREVLANSVYFGVYYECYRNSSCQNSFISGGVAGCLSWLVTHPIDTIKSRIQSYQVYTIREAIALGNVWKGLSFSLIRGCIVNAVGFSVYQHFMNVITI